VYAQSDRRAGGDGFGTSRWTPGRTVRDVWRVPIPLGTPPGAYQIEVGLYHASSGVRLPVKGRNEDRVLLGEIGVERGQKQPTASATFADVGPLKLIERQVEQERYRPGEEVRIRLLWQVTQLEETPTIVVRAVGPDGRVVERR